MHTCSCLILYIKGDREELNLHSKISSSEVKMSDDDIFLTQSTFSQPLDISVNTELAEECATNLLDFSLDCDLLNESPPAKKSRVATSIYQPSVSDISDDELVASCQEVERNEDSLNSRFGDRPLDDEYVRHKSKKRYAYSCCLDA